jgi:hypothetical protein
VRRKFSRDIVPRASLLLLFRSGYKILHCILMRCEFCRYFSRQSRYHDWYVGLFMHGLAISPVWCLPIVERLGIAVRHRSVAGVPTLPRIPASCCDEGESEDDTHNNPSNCTSAELSFFCNRVAEDAAESCVGPTICGSGQSRGSLRAASRVSQEARLFREMCITYSAICFCTASGTK